MKNKILVSGISLSILLSSMPAFAGPIDFKEDRQAIKIVREYDGENFDKKIDGIIKGFKKASQYGALSQERVDELERQIIDLAKRMVNTGLDEEVVNKGLDKLKDFLKELDKVDTKGIEKSIDELISSTKTNLTKEKVEGISKEIKEYDFNSISRKIDGIVVGLENGSKYGRLNQFRIDGLEKGLKDIESMIARYSGDLKPVEESLNKYKKTLENIDGVEVGSINKKIDELISSLGNSEVKEDKKQDKASPIKLSDVGEQNWFYEDVMELVRRGGLSGYKDGSFRPNKEISFAEFLKLAITSVTEKDYPLIQDVHWGMTYYQEAIKEGIIKEGDFGARTEDFNKPITREDMSYILMNINEKIQGEEVDNVGGIEKEIKDYKSISEDRLEKVLQAYKKGIIGGKSKGFEPMASTTRAEAATVIMRVIDKGNRLK